MGKKHKAKLKEIERLRALYQQTGNPMATEATAPAAPSASQSTVANVHEASDDHSQIRKDLMGLVILIIVMLAFLVGFYWLVQNTGFSGWLLRLFGA